MHWVIISTGGGYIGYFIYKFICWKLPFLLNVHPYDFIAVPHGIFRGIFFCIVIFLISKFINIYKESTKLFILFYLFLVLYMIETLIIQNCGFIINIYRAYRYLYAHIFVAIFLYYIFKNIIGENNSKITKVEIIIICFVSFCAYSVGTSVEINYIICAILSYFLIFYNFILILLSKITKCEEIYKNNKYNLNVKFFIPVFFLFLGIVLSLQSEGFRTVAAHRGAFNINICTDEIKEFIFLYVKQLIIHEWFYYLLFIVLIGFSFFVSFKRREIKKVIIPLLLQISIMIAMFSLFFCGKTYDIDDITKGYWLLHHELNPLYWLWLIYPITICFSYWMSVFINKKISFVVLLAILIISFFVRWLNIVPNFYIDIHPMEQKHKRQYIYEKIMRFYYLKGKTPIIPSFIVDEDFPELRYIDYDVRMRQLWSNYEIYQDDNVFRLGYIVQDGGLQKFYEEGGVIESYELENIKYSRLYDKNFVLGQKSKKNDK